MTRRPFAFGGIAAAALALSLLSGCTATTPSSTTVPTAGTTPSPQATTPAPEPTAPPAAAATCATVLSAEGYEKITTDGLEPVDPPQVFDQLAVRMTDSGGVACSWGRPRTDLVLTVVQLPVRSADEATWIQALAETGYAATDDPVPSAHTGQPDAANGISPVAVLSSGTLTFVSSPAFAGLIAPAS